MLPKGLITVSDATERLCDSPHNPAAALGCLRSAPMNCVRIGTNQFETGSIPAALCGTELSSSQAPQHSWDRGALTLALGTWFLSVLTDASLQEHLSVSHNSLTTLHGELSGLPCLRVSVPLIIPPASMYSQAPLSQPLALEDTQGSCPATPGGFSTHRAGWWLQWCLLFPFQGDRGSCKQPEELGSP